MIRLLTWCALFVVLWGRPLLASGTELDQDYFTANQSLTTQQLLHLVDTYHTNKVVASIREQNMNLAIVNLKYTLDRFPNHPRALMLLGSVAQFAKIPSLAIPYYERALKLYPQYALTHAQYGEYLVTIGRPDDGIARLKRAIELDPTLPVAYGWLATAYSKKGQVELARQAAEQAKALGYRATH